MKKTIVLGLLAGTMLFNAGCTDGEVAAGAIGVIIGIGLGDGGHDHHRPPPYRPRHRYDAEANLAVANSNKVVSVQSDEADAQLADFSFKYNVSLDAASKVRTAFEGVQTSGLDSFAAIGLNKKDVESLMKHQLPSSSSIKSMAGKLDMSEAQARDFVVAMNREFESQAADIQSPYWQACMAKGKWKTPQNLYCKSTSWTGCAPESGATLCY